MRVALVCPTVGQTRRGYERFCTDLFSVLRDDVDVTLLKGAGASQADEIVVPHFTRSALNRLFGERLRSVRHRLEFASFALALFPRLARGRYDLVHFIDPQLGPFLRAFKRVLPRPFRLLFTSGYPFPYREAVRWADHIHCLTPGALAQAEAEGIPAHRLTMLPVGVDTRRFAPQADRPALRSRYGVAHDTFVILAVTTLNRHHKRVDHLIEEVAGLEGDVLLWVEGSVHPDGDPDLLLLGAERLGRRFRRTHVPSEAVSDLYRLADVMVSTAEHESFGMAIIEAMCCGTPVVTHDSDHFRWLVGDAGHRIDMRMKGELARFLSHVQAHRTDLNRRNNPLSTAARFGWSNLKPDYTAMYVRTLSAREP